MTEAVALLAIILMVAFCEWREFKLRAELKSLSEKLEKFSEVSMARQEKLEECVEDLDDMTQNWLQVHDFMSKASTDLATIVQEYEINGIWIGKDRNRGVDAYEG